MLANPRILCALLCLAAGVVLAPFVPVDSETIDWQLMADAYTHIFTDGFEDGTTSAWSSTVGDGTFKIFFAHRSPIADEIIRSMDSSGRAQVPTALLYDLEIVGYRPTDGPTTHVEDCRVRIDEENVIITFFLPLS